MNKNQKKSLFRIIISACLLILVFITSHILKANDVITFILYLIPYLIIGFNIIKKSAMRLKKLQFLDENFLMTIAGIGAFLLGEYIEAVAVMLFYTVGELFESIAVGKSRKSISDLMDISPEYANIEKDNNIIQTDPYNVCPGDIIIVKPGERVPLDGIVTEGSSMLDTSALTGESTPVEIFIGQDIYSGSVNINGLLKVKVTKSYTDSTVSKILELVETSVLNKSKSENFITKFSRYYTPAVVGSALAIAIIPPIFWGHFAGWISKALVFLVVSCPCALVISVPLSFFAGIGAASKKGILIKGSSFIEKLSKSQIMAFDKTGTLTKGSFEVTQINAVNKDLNTFTEIAAKAEYYSNHPIAISVKNLYKGTIDADTISDVEEIHGMGICATIDGEKIFAGNSNLMDKSGVEYDTSKQGTVVHIAKQGMYLGNIVISDALKDETQITIELLKKLGIKKTVMLTGDKKETAQAIAICAGIDEYYGELFPKDKVYHIENMIKGSKAPVIYTGDGINDAPVIARADVGIAMGAIGSDCAIEAADIVIMDDNLSKIPIAYKISKKTMRIVKQNIIFSIGIKVLVMLLSVLGYANLWLGIFADVGVSVIAILNAIRCFKFKS